MCVIMGFAPGTMPEKEHLTNATWNNWHSWGLLLKDANSKVQMLKDCPEGGNDPELIWKMLDDNKDIERVLHLRHNTKGATNLDNAQPFPVYIDGELEVYFMHNGTLHQFGDSDMRKPDGLSDTKDFCNKVIIPSLERWNGPLGKADYTDEMYFKCVIERPWSMASKGLFFSNKYPALAIGDGWVKYNDGKNGDITASNDTYFRTLQRGPEFDRREKIRKDEAAATQAALFRERQANNQDTTPTRDSRGVFGTIGGGVKIYSPGNLEKSPEIIDALNHIHKDINFNDDEEVTKALFALTHEEICEFIEQEPVNTIAAMFQKLSEAAYANLCEKKTAIRDLERKDDFIRRIRIENEELKNGKSEAA